MHGTLIRQLLDHMQLKEHDYVYLCIGHVYFILCTGQWEGREPALYSDVRGCLHAHTSCPCASSGTDVAEETRHRAFALQSTCEHHEPSQHQSEFFAVRRIEEEVLQKTSLEPKDDLAPVSLSEVQTLVKSLNTRRHRPRCHSCPQQVLRLVEYVSEGFETERSTVAVFFDVAKAFDRVWHAEQEFLKAPPSLCCTPRTQTIYRDRHRLASNSRYSRTIPLFTEIGIGAPDSPPPLQRAIDELGQWFRKWRIEVNPDKSAAIQFKYGVTLDKNLHFRDHIERVRNTALFYKARLGTMLGRKSKLSRRNKRTIYKMCIRTVMTYASPSSLAPKSTTDYRTHRSDSSTSRDHIPMRSLRAAVDYQPPHPTLSVGHETYLPIHLTLLQRQLKALMTSTTRMTDLEQGREPTRDGFLRHPMPRRLPPGVVHSACHAPSALACAVRPHSEEFFGFQSHTTHAYGREGVQDRHFLPPPHRKRETKKSDICTRRSAGAGGVGMKTPPHVAVERWLATLPLASAHNKVYVANTMLVMSRFL
ncbi:hypothetical protein EVAR_12153_1 [Eumeta japonica]|uniref:Uncharacterized protein n=1 Tax=Eumeta variegata TaxID=151549 RepID=A0A4C1UI99_EUMVA|nr:hypothetical protein EVAR_12153_1 [Eumeta japonica]